MVPQHNKQWYFEIPQTKTSSFHSNFSLSEINNKRYPMSNRLNHNKLTYIEKVAEIWWKRCDKFCIPSCSGWISVEENSNKSAWTVREMSRSTIAKTKSAEDFVKDTMFWSKKRNMQKNMQESEGGFYTYRSNYVGATVECRLPLVEPWAQCLNTVILFISLIIWYPSYFSYSWIIPRLIFYRNIVVYNSQLQKPNTMHASTL